jgi:hypothetical protein
LGVSCLIQRQLISSVIQCVIFAMTIGNSQLIAGPPFVGATGHCVDPISPPMVFVFLPATPLHCADFRQLQPVVVLAPRVTPIGQWPGGCRAARFSAQHGEDVGLVLPDPIFQSIADRLPGFVSQLAAFTP